MSKYFVISHPRDASPDGRFNGTTLKGLDVPSEWFDFTSLEFIQKPTCYIYKVERDLIEIFLPESDPDFKMIEWKSKTGWSANKIIIGDRYSLGNIDTFRKFNLNIEHYDMCSASENGHIEVLQWWRDSGLELKYNNSAMDHASAGGYTDTLQWWRNSGLELKYSAYAMDQASCYNRVDVLRWWKSSGLELKYSTTAMSWWCDGTEALQWWKDSGLELKINFKTIISEICCRHVGKNIHQWWLNSGLVDDDDFPLTW
jgi:hypothetical protein